MAGQLDPCAFQPLVNDPLGQGEVVRGPDAVEMANRDVVGSGDLLGVQAGIGQVILDVPFYPQRQQGNRHFARTGPVGCGRADERANQLQGDMSDHWPRTVGSLLVHRSPQSGEVRPRQAVHRAGGQPRRGRPRLVGREPKLVVVDHERQGTGDTGRSEVEGACLVDEVKVAGADIECSLHCEQAAATAEQERHGEPTARGDPELIRPAADPHARTDGVQQVHARSQVPSLHEVPDIGT